MTAYSTRYAQAAASQRASQTRRTVNQNVTTNNNQVEQAQALEAQRRAQGKPPARTP